MVIILSDMLQHLEHPARAAFSASVALDLSATLKASISVELQSHREQKLFRM